MRGCRSKSEIAVLEKTRPAGMSRNRFCKLMHLNRSNLYYKPKGENFQVSLDYIEDHPLKMAAESAVASPPIPSV